MLLTLLLTLSATSFIAKAANEEVDAEINSFELVSLDAQEIPVQIAPVQPDDVNSPTATLKCPSGEVLDKCPSYCPSDFCPTGPGQNKKCPQPSPCPPPACKCRFNSRRAVNGTCIPTRSCPSFECSNPYEVYDPCPPYCPTDSCSQATPTGKCPLPGRIGIILECQPACRCQKDYWRKNGTCVPYNQCPGKLTCGANEVVDECPSDCESDKCPTSDVEPQSCPKPCQCPPPACKCRFNYSRAPNGTCIPTRQCPPFECYKPNEVYNPCPPYCPTDDCSQATPDGRCPLLGQIGITVQCRPKCRCKPGYWRLDGFCVPYDKCPGNLKCPPGEVVDNCPQLCNTDSCPKHQDDVRTCYTPIRCVEPTCKCPFNHLRAENGTCIPADSCPVIECNRPHEVYNPCPPACPSDDCSQATPSGECPLPGRIGIVVECRPSCRCEKGYWRQNGTCVPFGQCGLDCSGPNEEYGCGSACDTKCKTLNQKCTIVNIRCNDKCYCKQGFARDDKGICIPISECPKIKNDTQCPFPNEEYTDCKKECPSDTCFSIVSRCIPSDTCSPGCVCSSGYFRKAEGEPCVPMCQCPELENTLECQKNKSCPFPNEEYTDCKKQCPSDRCSSIVELCAQNDTCSPGCVCSPGYLRTADAEPCVPKCECPQYEFLPECKKEESPDTSTCE